MAKIGKNITQDVARSEFSYNAPLTEKQSKYAIARARGLPHQTALRQAGYSDNTFPELEKDPRIQALVQEERAKFEAANNISRKRVFDGFLESIELARINGEPMTMVAGWREIGKMAGYYEPEKKKIDISINGQMTVSQLQALSDAELLALADGQIIDGEFRQITKS